MSIKPILALGKLWLLFLLVSNPVAARTIAACSDQDSKTETFFKAGDSVHKDGLQPQAPSVRIISEQHAKPLSLGWPVTEYENACLVLGYTGNTVFLLQDVNRCESVSRFLFPYHIFW